MPDYYIQQAFDQVCKEAKQPEEWYVVLMEKVPYYGGPEEGGWWGSDHVVVAFQQFPTEELANATKDAVEKLATELQDEARKSYGDQCLREMEWLDARGLDANFLPEPDGPSEFYVRVTNEVPANHYGTRQYS